MEIKPVTQSTMDICTIFNDKGNAVGINDYAVEIAISENDYNLFILGGVPYLYDNGVYVPDRTGALLKSIIKEYMPENLVKSTTINRVYNLFLQDYKLEISEEQVNSYPATWIPFEDYLYDVVTNMQHDYKPEYRVINRIPYKHTQVICATDRGRVDAFIEQAILPEDRQTILEYIGYCLSRNNSFQKMILLKGGRGTGKSVLLSLIEKAVGLENVSNVPLQNIEEKFHSIQLLHKLVNICADLSALPLKTTNSIKLVTGGDYITDSYKGKDLITFRTYCKCIFSCNTVPLILDNDVSNAFYRRLCIVEMNNPPDKPDRELLSSMEKEIPHLILLALQAYKQALDRGYLFESEHSKALVKELYSDSDSVQAFLDRCTVQDLGQHIEKSLLYRMYLDYCEDADRQPLQKQNFNRHLRSKGLIEYKSNVDCWRDISLLDWKNLSPFAEH